jgi:hemerythrin
VDEELFSAAFVSGFGPIDEQHRALFRGLQTFLAAVQAADRLEATAAAHALVGATGAHFAWEQARMAESGFPGARAHAADHATFLAELEQLASELAREGVSARARLWVARFADWFRFHTRAQDAALARHLRERAEREAAGAAPRPEGARAAGAA